MSYSEYLLLTVHIKACVTLLRLTEFNIIVIQIRLIGLKRLYTSNEYSISIAKIEKRVNESVFSITYSYSRRLKEDAAKYTLLCFYCE